jgi:hypothetical protein
MDWYYCPRDPGCITYKMSVKEVFVRANDYSGAINAEKLVSGNTINIEVKGVTVLTSIPTSGSFRIYDLAGKNMYAGVLSDVMSLSGKDFVLNITFQLDPGAFAPVNWLEWGLDVFQDKSGTNEAMCIEFADTEYLVHEENTVSPPFVDYCVDNGDGTFRNQTIAIKGNPIPAPVCHGTCDLDWYYCPRDPGCTTYTMSVESVEVDVKDKVAIRVDDVAKLIVHGTTSLTSVPVAGSYRIYQLSGGNAAEGVLSDVMTISNCGALGCDFVIVVPTIVLSPGMFNTKNRWFEFGLDVFQKQSGSDEGMCIEVANSQYVHYQMSNPSPPFEMLCKDEGWGHFQSQILKPDPVHNVTCNLL